MTSLCWLCYVPEAAVQLEQLHHQIRQLGVRSPSRLSGTPQPNSLRTSQIEITGISCAWEVHSKALGMYSKYSFWPKIGSMAARIRINLGCILMYPDVPWNMPGVRLKKQVHVQLARWLDGSFHLVFYHASAVPRIGDQSNTNWVPMAMAPHGWLRFPIWFQSCLDPCGKNG